MPNSLKNKIKKKVIIVIGGNGYLGKSICDQLEKDGNVVISVDKYNNISKQKDNLRNIKADITNPRDVEIVTKKILKIYNTIDTVIYSVTGKSSDFYKPFTDCSLKGWKSILDVELNGLFNVAKYFGKIFEKQNFGNFIFISSIYGIVGNDQRIYQGSNLNKIYIKNNKKIKINEIFSHAAYPAAKGGVIALTKFLAAYWGHLNVRVNCISPGGITFPGENKTFIKKYSSKVPLGRKAKLYEVTDSVLFLVSDKSSYINGHNLIVDGGYTIW